MKELRTKQSEGEGPFVRVRNLSTQLKLVCHLGFRERHYPLALRVDLNRGKIDYKLTNSISQNKPELVVPCVPNSLAVKPPVNGK